MIKTYLLLFNTECQDHFECCLGKICRIVWSKIFSGSKNAPIRDQIEQGPAFGEYKGFLYVWYVFDHFFVFNNIFCTMQLPNDSTCVSEALITKAKIRSTLFKAMRASFKLIAFQIVIYCMFTSSPSQFFLSLLFKNQTYVGNFSISLLPIWVGF